MPDLYDPVPYRLQPTDTERLSDITKVGPELCPSHFWYGVGLGKH